MGATSSQGWCLFVFMVGFVLGPAGLVVLGWPVALSGFALMALALGGFRRAKGRAVDWPPGAERTPVAPVGQRAAKSY